MGELHVIRWRELGDAYEVSEIKKVSRELLTRNKVWIYGIGVIGKRVCQICTYFKIHPEGIVVSSAKENIDCYMGIPVKGIDSIKFDDKDLIMVAVNGKGKEEIIRNLSKTNVNYVIWNQELLSNLWKDCNYVFESRVKGKKKICMVLSGYKNYLWDRVFGRLVHYLSEDVEVCLCSAGKYVKDLSKIASDNKWSYLSSEANSVSVIQNICVSLYPNVEWIYKMDEDMFVTKGVFENVLSTAERILESQKYELGVVSPLIPVNAIGYRAILEKYNLLKEFESRFGTAVIGGCAQREIEKNPETAKFMWGDSRLPQIDKIAEDIYNESDYQICTTRLSIGFILFQRKLWEEMQGIVAHGNMDLGIDEEDINGYCINNSKIMTISMNSVVGHFAFGKQTDEMKRFYAVNQDRF